MEARERRTGPWIETVWDLRDLAAFEQDERTPAEVEGLPWLQYSQFGSWAEVARWADGLYRIGNDRQAVEAAIEEAAGDLEPVRDRATAVTRWVQDELRYFAIVLGPNSHAPHDPAVTLRQRYGDCKDKSLLLARMLRGLGLEAWPALVTTDDGRLLPTRLPSPGAFNHVIVLARLEDRDVWIDPTWMPA